MGVPSTPARYSLRVPSPPAYPWPPKNRERPLLNIAVLFEGTTNSDRALHELVIQLLESSPYRDRIRTSEFSDNIGVAIRLRSQLDPFPRLETRTILINDQPEVRLPPFLFRTVVSLLLDELNEKLIPLVTELLPY